MVVKTPYMYIVLSLIVIFGKRQSYFALCMYIALHVPEIIKGIGARGGGGVLRYISVGDVRSPFLGLKFAI